MADNAASEAWGTFWQRNRESAAYRDGGPQEEALARFWQAIFDRFRGVAGQARVLDFACGNGAVSRYAIEASPGEGGDRPFVVGVDGAESALAALRARFPSILAVRADAGRTPFAGASFDLVASQFGVEYGGLAAVEEAARLVRPGGALVCVLHMRGGALYRECETSLRAIGRVRESQVLQAAKNVFRRGASALRGQGSRAGFQQADTQFATAVNELDALLREFGDAVAGGAVLRLFDDLAHMYRRIGAYDPQEVALWADRMSAEMDAYAGRMAAMLAVALDASQLKAAGACAAARGLAVRVSEEMRMGPGEGEPAAWVLIGERQ